MLRKHTGVQLVNWILLLTLLIVSGCSAQQSQSRQTSPQTEAADLKSIAIASADDWRMEGYSPQRTRATMDVSHPPLSVHREFMLGGETRFGSPVGVAGGLVFVEGSRKLHALTVDQGIEAWVFDLPGSYVSPTIVGNHVFVRAESGEDGYVVALTADTGLRLWQYKFPRVGSSQGNLGGHVTSPVVAEGLVLVGAGKSFLALDAETGKIQWSFDTDEPITSSATIADGSVFFVDFDNLYAIDLKTGIEQWRFAQQSLSVVFAPIVIGDQIVTTNDDTIHMLDRQHGTILWTKTIQDERLVPAGALHDRIYIKSVNTLYAFDLANGDDVWAFHVTDYVSLPAITEDVIYIVTRAGGTGQLRAIDLVAGQEVWQSENARLANSAPIVAKGHVYVRTVDGSLLIYEEG